MHTARLLRPIVLLLVVIADALAAETLAANNAPSPAVRPNIVFILVDDLGYGDLSCYGQTQFATPNIDRLAGEGLKFTRHYAGNTVCAPSRSSLMTGQDTGHTYLRGNGQQQLRPDPDDITVATHLNNAGYRTAMFGKSCVTGNTQDPAAPLAKGFETFYGMTSHSDSHRQWPPRVYDQTRPVIIDGNTGTQGPVYINDSYTERAIAYIKDPDPRPFFVLLSLTMPHADVDVPADSSAPFADRFPDDLPFKKSSPGRTTPTVKAAYAGMVSRLDRYVGQVLDALAASGRDRDTLVIFTSDNGPHGEGGYSPALFNSSGGLRGMKRDLYEGGLRVPFLARWPASIAPGRETAHVAAFWDFLPTALELAGAPPASPEQIQGLSYAPTLTGCGEQRVHDRLYWEFHELGGRRALLEGDWKLVQYDVNASTSPAYQLFNLATDPTERRDLADHEPERVASMAATLAASRVPSPIKDWNFTR